MINTCIYSKQKNIFCKFAATPGKAGGPQGSLLAVLKRHQDLALSDVFTDSGATVAVTNLGVGGFLTSILS